ncbi:hypothetical protein CMO92_03855 [Candidatus Woesearchaeota archaeon]|nr:hypothetical protein [Candidatus Woesearchaeota archaeon]
MARFDRSKDRKGNKDFRDRSPNKRKKIFDDEPRRRRETGRGSTRSGRDRGGFQLTKARCASCRMECEVPFKPTLNKPVFCKDCFKKKENSGSEKQSSRELDAINEKLDKILRALGI